jgi:prepilin-type N-terminal cleavage/methylation domain-containing protein
MTALPPSAPSRRARGRGFTLTELAVVLAIVGLLLGSLMYTLSAQTEQRSRDTTLERLDQARELLVAFAMVNGRLPCPAGTTGGDEVFATGSAATGGGTCSFYLNGYLPARAIGFRPVDGDGYALDAWNNRIRYALARDASNPSGGTGCTPTNPGAFSSTANLKSGGVACVPANLVICDASQNTSAGAPPGTPPSCGTYGGTGDARPVTNQLTVVAVVFSTGKNTLTSTPGADENENTDPDGVFVWHEPRPTGATGGEFDDLVRWIPIGELYARMVSAGVLP